ncbi:MAG: zinc carboxypeptidase [Myxococcaceae bacterium]|nr:zinc carboxypeptidase [Myxococcaceae bacterium]
MLGPLPLPELRELETLLELIEPHARIEVLAHVAAGGRELPIYAAMLGTCDPAAPSLAFVGGVHGLERIGTQVVLAYLRTLSSRLSWDRVLTDTLSRVRLVFVPLLNPGGMLLGMRANPRGVDLMRNAPRGAGGRGTFLLGGQRISARLPWYAGDAEACEVESRALFELLERELLSSDVALAIDCHSGFGMLDRLWFPYARTRKPFPNLAEVVGLKRLLDLTLPHHVYRVEPQANAYTIEGDAWDYLYDRQRAAAPSRVFVPLTLEMGSWAWVRKNPRQLWSLDGGFNPVLPHRIKRTLRRHLSLFDLLLHAIASHEAWIAPDEQTRSAREHEAFSTWPRT